MSTILFEYRKIMRKTEKFVINAFQAADLNGDGLIAFSEFELLFRYIEHDKYDPEEVYAIFEENADIMMKGEHSMSFDKFTAVCVEHMLFSDAA